MNNIAILGATGSIGSQAIEIVKENYKNYNIELIVIRSQTKKLKELLGDTKIKNLYVEKANEDITSFFPNTNILKNKKEVFDYISNSKIDVALNAISGFSGLDWTIHLIKSNIDIALANKESLVVAGGVISKILKESRTKIYPVDSEHSAIYQCLNGEDAKTLKRIILTCSGGPFRDYSKEQIAGVTLQDALKHPNWSMGKKITIDSATLFNKALEIIEAKWLFNTTNIDVLIHYESIVHSMIEFNDKTIIAQMSLPSMKLPILYGLNKGKRTFLKTLETLDLTSLGSLNFKKINRELFPAIDLAYLCLEKGGSYPVVLNAANEYMVDMFLKGKCQYKDIYLYVKKAIAKHNYISDPNLEEIKWIHNSTIEKMKG